MNALLVAMLGMMIAAVVLMVRERRVRRRAEARLAAGESLSRASLESMVHAVITLTPGGVVLAANGSAKRMFGYAGEDIVGRGIDELTVTGEGDAPMSEYVRSLGTDFREWGHEVTARSKDGTLFRARASIGDHGSGEARILTVTLRDMAPASEVGRLRTSEQQLREITNAMPALIAYVDAGHRYRFHNRAYHEAFGLTREQIDGHTMLEVFGEEIDAEIAPHVAEVLAGTAVKFERTHTYQGKKRSYSVQYVPRHGEGANRDRVIGFYTLSTDISDLKRVDRMKTEFISMVSHELRTPLTSIRGSLGLIAGGVAGNLPDVAKHLIDIAKNNCERLIRLINDILDTEKIESGKMRWEQKVAELAPLAAEAIAANEGYAAKHEVRLDLTTSCVGARINVDTDRFKQVVTNLLSNAVRFSPPGATVLVALSRAAGRVRVEVRDRGTGIPEQFRARIFQKFSQADASDARDKGGNGLGLNISKAIVERFGGTIGFETLAGAGTTFFFEIPEWSEAPARAAQRDMKRPCVLVCEDDPDIAALIGMMLDKAGYDTDLAYTAKRARELAAEGSYAAMTVDLELTGENGVSLARSLRSGDVAGNVPIVVVSASADAGRIRLNSESLSVSGWLGQSVGENALVAAVGDAVAGRTKGRPRILHVEDDSDMRAVTAAIVNDLATVESAATLREARARLACCTYDLVLLDLNLPEGEGTGWSLVSDIEALDPSPPVVVFSLGELRGAESRRVASVLPKTDAGKLLETLQRLLRKAPAASTKAASRAQTA